MSTDHRSAWYRFSVKSLLMSMAVISLGVTLLIWSAAATIGPFSLFGWIAGAAFVGAGLLYPFGKAGWGALIGGAFQLTLLILAYVVLVLHD